MTALTDASVVHARLVGPVDWGQPLYRLSTAGDTALGAVVAVAPDPVRHAWRLALCDADDREIAVLLRQLTGWNAENTWLVLDPSGEELARMQLRTRLVPRPHCRMVFRRGKGELARATIRRMGDPWSLVDPAGRVVATLTPLKGEGERPSDRRIELLAGGAEERLLGLSCALTQLAANYSIRAAGPPPKTTVGGVLVGDGPGSPGLLGALGEALRAFR